MREILFRGKKVDNGEWVEGNFIDPCNIVWMEKGFDKVLQREDMITFDEPVRPETVGQYTGLTDKNGKKIFEGDIIKEISMRFSTMEIEECFFAVEWCDFDFSYRLIRRFDNGERTTILTRQGDYEIIGNIHDNPELLEAIE